MASMAEIAHEAAGVQEGFVRKLAYVHFAAAGGLSVAAVGRLAEDAVEAAWNAAASRVLLDLQQWELGQDMGDGAALAERLVAATASSGLNLAVVFSAANAAQGRLIETMCVHRGAQVKAFFDPFLAKVWLLTT